MSEDAVAARTPAERLELRDPNDLSLGGFADTATMRFVRDYPHPPAAVWAALTTAEDLSAWLWPCKSAQANAGGVFVFDMEGHELSLPVLVLEPERRLSLGGVLRFELRAHDGGCRLILTLKRPPDGWSPMGLAGFHGWLGRLGRLLAKTPQDETELWAGAIWNGVVAHYENEIRQYVAGGAKVIWRVHFDENDPSLTAEAKAQLDALAAVLAAGELAVTIDGFGDDPCAMDESERLCRARVEAAAAHLRGAGTPGERINIGFVLGNYHYLVERDCAAGRAFNRRIELRPIY